MSLSSGTVWVSQDLVETWVTVRSDTQLFRRMAGKPRGTEDFSLQTLSVTAVVQHPQNRKH